jgi:hypothetical protein
MKRSFFTITHGGTIVTENFGIPSIADIAFCLNKINRYNGSSDQAISVASHSLLVWAFAKDRGWDCKLQIGSLFHDAAEAVIGDIPSPLKTEYFDKFEKKIINRIMYSIGVPELTEEEDKAVNVIDKEVLSLEVHSGFGPNELKLFVPRFNYESEFGHIYDEDYMSKYPNVLEILEEVYHYNKGLSCENRSHEIVFKNTALSLIAQYHNLE